MNKAMDQATSDRLWQLLNALRGDQEGYGEKIFEVANCEKQFLKELLDKYYPSICAYDTFSEFYYLMLLEISKLLNEKGTSKEDGFLVILHIATFQKIYSSYKLFTQGYLSESLALIRGIWENVLIMIAYNKKIIGIDDYFLKIQDEEMDTSKLSLVEKFKRHKKFRGQREEFNRKIFTPLIKNNKYLSEEDKYSLNAFLDILNRATHQSNLYIVTNFGKWIRGEKKLSIPPVFQEDDKVLVEMNINYFLWNMFLILKTINFVDIFKNAGKEPREKLATIIEIFDVLTKYNPAKTTTSILAFAETI